MPIWIFTKDQKSLVECQQISLVDQEEWYELRNENSIVLGSFQSQDEALVALKAIGSKIVKSGQIIYPIQPYCN